MTCPLKYLFRKRRKDEPWHCRRCDGSGVERVPGAAGRVWFRSCRKCGRRA